MIKPLIFSFEKDGKTVLGFDTCLDSRAFAQAKFAQVITEPGFIVKPVTESEYPSSPHPIAIELWKASGVVEYANTGSSPTMVVWGQNFEGERLDLIINDNGRQDDALKAINAWILAVCALGENIPLKLPEHYRLPLQPFAAIIGSNGDVFFSPPSLALRCMTAAGEAERLSGGEWYIHPDPGGTELAAFTAAAMLYRVFAGTPPFTATDESILHQDMRDGNNLPAHLAIPGLDAALASAINRILVPPKKNVPAKPCGRELLGEFHKLIRNKTVSSLVHPVSETDLRSIEKEKNTFQKITGASVKTRRFVARNTALLLGSLAAFVAALFVAHSFAQSRARLPTTAGMEPAGVIETYYKAIGDLDHQLMEACVTGNAGKDDIGMVINFFVIGKMRQAYGVNAKPAIVSAKEWLELGGVVSESAVLGVTDIKINEQLTMSKGEEAFYQVRYTFWYPAEADDPLEKTETAQYRPPKSIFRTDTVTLVRKKGNWRIAEIQRQVTDNE